MERTAPISISLFCNAGQKGLHITGALDSPDTLIGSGFPFPSSLSGTGHTGSVLLAISGSDTLPSVSDSSVRLLFTLTDEDIVWLIWSQRLRMSGVHQ